MMPTHFPQANSVFYPPSGMDESQCSPIPAYSGVIEGDNLDGANVVVVAWQPSEEEKKQIADGNPIYLLCIGGLPPHSLYAEFPFK